MSSNCGTFSTSHKCLAARTLSHVKRDVSTLLGTDAVIFHAISCKLQKKETRRLTLSTALGA